MQRLRDDVWQWTTINANWPSALFLNAMTFFMPSPIASDYARLAKLLLGDSRSAESWLEEAGEAAFLPRNAASASATRMGLSCAKRRKEIIWKSRRLKIHAIMDFTTGDATAEERPLAVLAMAILGAEYARLACADFNLTIVGNFRPPMYVLIDAIDTTHRAHELPCGFLTAVQQSYYPGWLCLWRSPIAPMIAGQVWCGLSRCAGLHWPERFGCIK